MNREERAHFFVVDLIRGAGSSGLSRSGVLFCYGVTSCRRTAPHDDIINTLVRDREIEMMPDRTTRYAIDRFVHRDYVSAVANYI